MTVRRPADPRGNRARRMAGAALLALAAVGAGVVWHAVTLSGIRLWCAVLLVQVLALAAAIGAALVVALPGGGSGHTRPPWGMIRR